MAPTRVKNLMQTLIDGEYGLVQIPTSTIPESELNSDILSVFDHPRPIGISPGYSADGRLIALAIADDKNCRIVEFSGPQNNGRDRYGRGEKPAARNTEGLKLLEDLILCRTVGDIFAFDLGTLSMSLYCDASMRITNGVDIQSGISAVKRKPLDAIKEVVGDSVPIMEDNIIRVFRNPSYDKDDRNRVTDLAMRAWVSQFLPGYQNGADTFEKVPRINTQNMNFQTLEMIAKIANDALRLDQMKPMQTKHQFTASSADPTSGGTKFSAESYKNKLRPDRNVRMNVRGRGGSYVVNGQIGGVQGRSANVSSARNLDGDKKVFTLTSIGRDDPTTAEAQRAATILRILQGSESLLDDSPWIKNIWFPLSDDALLIWPEDWTPPSSRATKQRPQASRSAVPDPDGNLGRHNLNSSQQKAVDTMLSSSDTHRITLIQGPPGTGKTSVIARFVQLSIESGNNGLWLVAQSNVAVKNIAEKLMAVGFLDWKLLVSKDFHFEWHEHLYTKIRDHIIRSDEFNKAAQQMRGCQVILCTLSMLSNPNIGKFKSQVPFKTLVVDEASQIQIGDYISIFAKSYYTLRKVCFIGDDKQLPPYGQEDLQDLQSIFEITHLRRLALFLDTQYRMPPQIGNFISKAVYDEKLKSNPKHPITDDIIACYFIDAEGKEQKHGDSFMNTVELEAVLKIAQHLQEQEKQYQIITPYEGQRSSIENEMKNIAGLQWENKCFNVDAFQGNEEDYIIISLVRSRSLGFLDNLRRTNVMLTRCKKGMFIVTSHNFLGGIGATSLAGELMEHVGDGAWLDMKDLEEGNF